MNGSYSHAFRMTPCEIGAVSFMRCRMGMSMNHIADTLSRSTATVHLALRKNKLLGITDNRGKPEHQHQNRITAYTLRREGIREALQLWKDHEVDSFREALEITIKGFGRIPGQKALEQERLTRTTTGRETLAGHNNHDNPTGDTTGQDTAKQEGSESKNRDSSPVAGEDAEDEPA